MGAATLVAAPLIYWMVGSGRRAPKTLQWGRCALDQEEYTKCRLVSVTKVSHNSALYKPVMMDDSTDHWIGIASNCPGRSPSICPLARYVVFTNMTDYSPSLIACVGEGDSGD